MTAALSIADTWNDAPVGPVVGEPHTPTHYRADLSQITENVQWLFNRLAPLIGTWQLVEAVNTSGDSLQITAHGLATNTLVRIASVGGSVPTGLFAAATYYKKDVDANNIQLSVTSGGGAVDITGAGSGTLYLYTVPDVLSALFNTALTTSGGGTIVGANVRAQLIYFLSILGGTMTGALKFSGNSAYEVWRDGALTDADQTFTGTNKHHWLQVEPTADRVKTIADGTEEGQWFIVTRRGSANAFKVDYQDSGTNLICRFPASAKSWALFQWSNQDGAGLKWHAEMYGGGAIP